MRTPSLHFVAAETIQSQLWTPVVQEAKSRGLSATMSAEPNVEADIGFYCDDGSLPGPQTLTVISLNGMDQGHTSRNDPRRIFSSQNWGLFDLGLLPGPAWARDYAKAADDPNCAPTMGSVLSGWPKSDFLFPNNLHPTDRISGKHGRRILYAPQIECDGKQDALIGSLSDANVRLQIKHWESSDDVELYPELLTNEYLNNLDSANKRAASLPWVDILSPKSNFLESLSNCDVLISDQSSVLAEALLCGIPTIAVSDWRHNCGSVCLPDRREVCVTTVESKLLRSLERIFADYASYVQRAIKLREENFSNLGFASSVVLDCSIGAWHLKKNLTLAKPGTLLDSKHELQHQQVLKLVSQLRAENRKLVLHKRLLQEVAHLEQSASFRLLRRIRQGLMRLR